MTGTESPLFPPPSHVPAVFAGEPKVKRRFWEFFVTQLANDNTRRAYFNSGRRFAGWCEPMGRPASLS
jgi:hypothetical protein